MTKQEKMRRYRDVFSTREGRIVLYDLLSDGGWIRSTFSENPYTMAYNNGKRDFVMGLLNTLALTPKQMEEIAKRLSREDMDDALV